MRKTMSMKDLQNLLQLIEEKHRFGRGKGKGIKYVIPYLDMRHRDIYAIDFRGWNDKSFSLVNENKDKNLFLWILSWLEDEDEIQDSNL